MVSWKEQGSILAAWAPTPCLDHYATRAIGESSYFSIIANPLISSSLQLIFSLTKPRMINGKGMDWS